jgi:methylated-DNA-[protein]-cysteine S-methyltransferase
MARAVGALLFDTTLGGCGVAWSEQGIVGMQLPEASPAQTRERLQRRHGLVPLGAPPAPVRHAVEGIVALLNGEPVDLSNVRLDLEGVPALHRRAYDIARSVRVGTTLTYGDIATCLGEPRLARAVGQAMARNPIPVIIPCHRVLAAGGRSGGFSAGAGVTTKLRLLAIEGAHPPGDADWFSLPHLLDSRS